MRAFVFPGQGSQFVGMGKDMYEAFPEARDIFEEISESLTQNLTALVFKGPESDLNLTENTQPALMAVSMAVVKVLQKQGGIDFGKACRFMAGHSLGEYTAFTAAGSFTLADTARLTKLRGQSMQKAVPVGQGSMAAILGPGFEEVEKICADAAQGRICAIANDNCEGQIVISGHAEAVERAMALASERGAKRCVPLPVSAPFHCPLMQPAADVMKDALAATPVKTPVAPVVANVTAQAETDPARIRDLLVRQITGQVRWRESVQWMAEQGVTEIYELGPGKVLSGLVRRIDKDILCESICTPEQIETLIHKLNG